jgi:hypothetical protein
MPENVEIRFTPVRDFWSWYVKCGNWQCRGYGDTLEDAEKHSSDYVKGIINHGIIHKIYDEGKNIKESEGKASDHWSSNL